MANTFFNRSVDEVLKQQESSPGGLSHAQAADRLERFGPNALVEGKRKELFKFFWNNLKICWWSF